MAGGIHRPCEFGRQHDVLATLAEDLAEARLGAAARIAIGVGFVKKGDAEVERLVNDPLRRLEIDAAAEIIAAEPHHRHKKAGSAETTLFHQSSSETGPMQAGDSTRASLTIPLSAIQLASLPLRGRISFWSDMSENWRQRIVIDPAIHHGEPCIKGTRVPVRVIVGSIADGDTSEQILEAWPQLTSEDVKAALKFAAEAVNNTDFIPLYVDGSR